MIYKRKLLDLSENCVKTIAKEAIDKGTTFKQLAEKILENHAAKAKNKA